MARQVRVEYEGAMYHVMARGDRREAIVGMMKIERRSSGRWGKRRKDGDEDSRVCIDE